ncbi:MAG: hypothetical protein KBF96_02340 [Ignavibacteria bacterium]|nr:hypothetical protein [Ignavibacteria bacterium]
MQLSRNITELKKSIKKNKYIDLVNPRLEYPKVKFLIYTRGRTGSTVLTDLLNCHPDIFCDVEIFNFLYSGSKVKFPEMYIKSCSKRAAKHGKSVYGFKVKIAQLRYEHGYDNYDEILSNLHKEGYKFLYLKRENYFRHKLSNIISAQTRIFHLKNGDKNTQVKINVDCEQLMEGIEYGEVVNKTELENLKNINHLTITYENDLIVNSRHQETADKIFNYLGLETVKVKTDLKRIVPEDLKEVILNYDEVYDYFKDTVYIKYLT